MILNAAKPGSRFYKAPQTPTTSVLKVINRYEEIYRQASKRMLTSSNVLAQLGALNVMLKANALMFQTAALPGLINRIKTLEDKTKKGCLYHKNKRMNQHVQNLNEKLKDTTTDSYLKVDFNSLLKQKKLISKSR